MVKKRAALALLRLLRKTPPENPVVAPESFSLVLNSLLDERDLGLLLSSTTLLQGICARNGPSESRRAGYPKRKVVRFFKLLLLSLRHKF